MKHIELRRLAGAARIAAEGNLALRKAPRLISAPVYVDVGSADGMPYRWSAAVKRGLVRAYLVDPLSWGKTTEGGIAVAVALGEENGRHPFFETRHPACSSCLRPNDEILARYPVRSWFDVVNEGTVDLRRADDVWSENSYSPPDFIKVDVQGLELPVLRGFGVLLDNAVGLELEAHFEPLYEREALFEDFRSFLTNSGWRLRHLSPQGPFEGDLVEVNSYWWRPELADDPRVQLWELLNALPARYHYRDAPPPG